VTGRPRVVIAGGGFGGLQAAKALRKAPVEVVLIDRNNYHLFQPLLYQVATGALSGPDIAAPLRWVFRRQENVQVLLGEVLDIGLDRREAVLADRAIRYDYLILAAGARTTYFGHDAWRTAAPGLKDLTDAGEIRSRVFCAFEAAEKAEREPDRQQWLTFVVIGAGPTGVELAGALAEIARDTLRGNFRNIRPEEARIVLLDLASRVLPAFPEPLSARAESDLKQIGVDCMLEAAVEDIDEHGVVARSRRGRIRIPARTVLWAAGVAANRLARVLHERAGAELDRTGRVLVERDCSLPGHPDVFVIGDMAAFRDERGRALPGLAPVAMQQGAYVGRLISERVRGRTTDGFRYRDKGILAAIGRNRAVAAFGNFRAGGILAWVLWLFVHLMYLVGFQNRTLVLIQWGFHYFTRNRRARLIVDRGPFCPDARPVNHNAAAAEAQARSPAGCGFKA